MNSTEQIHLLVSFSSTFGLDVLKPIYVNYRHELNSVLYRSST